MPAVRLTLPRGVVAERRHAELTLVGAFGAKPTHVVLPIVDPATQIQNLAGDWQQITRPGQAPIAARAGDQLTTIQVTATIAPPDGGPHDDANSVEPILNDLAFLAEADSDLQPIALTWGTFITSAWTTSTGYWHIQELEIDTQLMQPGTNNISRAEVTITLLEHSPAPSAAGSSSGKWNPPPAAPRPTFTANNRRVTYWTVAAGQTAYSIARAVYGHPEPGWRVICDANGIGRPSNIAPGQTLLIPQAP